MILFFLDDAVQSKPTRAKLGKLVSVGGLAIHEDNIQSLCRDLDKTCKLFGFPDGPQGRFKYSPGRELWMRTGLVEEERSRFYGAVLDSVTEHKGKALVVCVDSTCGAANPGSASSEDDVVKLVVERIEGICKRDKENGLIVFDRPPGGAGERDAFLERCFETLQSGTSFVQPQQILVPPLASSSHLCRPLQIADLIVSATTARIAGESNHSKPLVEKLLPLYDKPHDCIGGWGVKLHPDKKLRNLYHWIFGDQRARKGINSSPYPLVDYAFSTNEDDY